MAVDFYIYIYVYTYTYVCIYIYLESQVAQNSRPLYHKVAHNISKVAHNYRLLALQVF